SAGCGFLQLPSEFSSNSFRLLKQLNNFSGALHGRTVQTAADFELALSVKRLERAKLLGHAFLVIGVRNTNVNFRYGFSRDNISASAATNDAHVYGEAALKFCERGDALDLPR